MGSSFDLTLGSLYNISQKEYTILFVFLGSSTGGAGGC